MGIVFVVCALAYGNPNELLVHARDYGAARYLYPTHVELPSDRDELLSLLRHPDHRIRERAASEFIVQEPQLVGQMLEAFRKDYSVSGDTIWHAIDNLGSGHEQRAARNLEIRRIASAHPDPETRNLASVVLLEEVYLDEARGQVPELIEFLDNEHGSVRALSAFYLRVLAGRNSDESIELLVRLLTDPDPGVRRMAAYSLSKCRGVRMHGEDTKKALIRSIYDPATRFSAANAVEHIDFGSMVDDAVAALESALKDSDAQTRVPVARALGSLAPDCERASHMLLSLLADANRQVGVQAALVLAGWGEPAVDRLGRIAHGKDETARLMAVFALGRMDPPVAKAVPYLIDSLSDASSEVRLESALSLSNLGDLAKPAIPVLANLLTDTDPLLRAEAARAIGAVGCASDEVVGQLATMLLDENVNVRIGATQAMSEIGSGMLVARDPLMRNLSDANPNVRLWTTYALGQLPPSFAISSLTPLLSDHDPNVRTAAADALGRIGPAAVGAVPYLKVVERDENHWVRRQAKAALMSIRCSQRRNAVDLETQEGAGGASQMGIREDSVAPGKREG